MPQGVEDGGSRDGVGLRLGVPGGDSLRLAVTGYQFPDAEDLQLRCSWYMVEGSATVGGHGWDFMWQALTCDAAPLISKWFRLLATWVESESTDSAPDAPWLIEPNLQFRAASDRDGKVELVVELDNEFLPPERRRGRQAASEGPVVLTLRASPLELRDAADGFDATIAPFPDLTAPS